MSRLGSAGCLHPKSQGLQASFSFQAPAPPHVLGKVIGSAHLSFYITQPPRGAQTLFVAGLHRPSKPPRGPKVRAPNVLEYHNSTQMGSEAVSPMPVSLPVDGSVVKIKGLPFKASVEDVLKFYSGFNLSNGSVYLKRHADGRLNGEVRIQAGIYCISICWIRLGLRNPDGLAGSDCDNNANTPLLYGVMHATLCLCCNQPPCTHICEYCPHMLCLSPCTLRPLCASTLPRRPGAPARRTGRRSARSGGSAMCACTPPWSPMSPTCSRPCFSRTWLPSRWVPARIWMRWWSGVLVGACMGVSSGGAHGALRAIAHS